MFVGIIALITACSIMNKKYFEILFIIFQILYLITLLLIEQCQCVSILPRLHTYYHISYYHKYTP